MGVFGVVFGCIGDAGFTLVCISGCRGVVGFKVAMSRVLCAKKFALLGLMWARARKSSPSKPKMGKICCFRARWASFFANQKSWDPTGRVCCAVRLAAGPVYWQC